MGDEMKSRAMIAAAAVATLVGCSAKPVVTDVSELGSGAHLAGVPFRVKTPHILRIYKLNEERDNYVEVASSSQPFANQQKLYALNIVGAPFSTRSLALSQNPDNTLKKMQVVGSDNSSGVIDAVTTALTGVAKADTDRKTAALTNSKAIVDADKAVRDAEKDLSGLSATASAESRALYENVLNSAKRQNNSARSAAGLPVVYPDVQ
jgi:hypothetical protein